jgi:hypothetical protein
MRTRMCPSRSIRLVLVAFAVGAARKELARIAEA